MAASMRGYGYGYDLDDTVCFYKDTINKCDKKLVCVFHQEYTDMHTNRKMTYRIKNNIHVSARIIENCYCRIGIDMNRKQINYSLDAFAVAEDFISLEDFLRTCEDEPSKIKISLKMIALYKTLYSNFFVANLSDLLYGKSYSIQKLEW
jgi:hypothetical protein